MPPLQPRDPNLAVIPAKRRPGRKRKSLPNRVHSPTKPIQHVERSYSHETKEVRRVTRRATKTPEEAVSIINNFLRFIRRISNKRSTALDRILVTMSPTRRFQRGCIINIDETPMPFEYLDGYTYEIKGSKTISGKSDRSGWNKHYNNEELLRQWISNELALILNGKEHLLVMDVGSFHTTEDVLQDLRGLKITTALIPAGCTSLLQPLDTAVNKPFKDWLAEAAFSYVEKHDPDGIKKWSVQDKRVMTTHTVAAACKRLSEQPDLVINAFYQCGISIKPDGSEDHKIRIKDVPSEAINFNNWEKAEEAVLNAYEIVDRMCDEEEICVESDDLTIALRTLRITDLKELLRLRGLPISGNKKDLLQRLENHILAPVGSSQQPQIHDNS
ncbi:hypothetical protein V2G26_007085 [Clonostachys chloroleuca]